MQTIYIGPSKRELDLHNSRIYLEKPTELIEKLKKKYPLIHLLFVDVNLLETAQKELQTKGTPIFKAFNTIK